MQWSLFKKQASPESMTPDVATEPGMPEALASDPEVVVSASFSPRFFHETDPLATDPPAFEILNDEAFPKNPVNLTTSEPEEPVYTTWGSPEVQNTEAVLDTDLGSEEWETPLHGVPEAEDMVMWLGEMPSVDEPIQDLSQPDSWMNVPAMDPEASIALISDLPDPYIVPELETSETILNLKEDTVERVEPPLELFPLSAEADPHTIDFSYEELPETASDDLFSVVLNADAWQTDMDVLLPEEPETVIAFGPPEEVFSQTPEALASQEIKIIPAPHASYADVLETLQRETLIEEVHFIQNSINQLVNRYFEDQALASEKR